MKVYVHTLARSKELLRGGATLVFETIRTGFPDAEICVVDGGSAKELIADIQAAVNKVGGQFVEFRKPGRHIGDLIWDVLREETGPVAFVDPDVIFWEKIEIPTDALWSGAYAPTRQEGGILSLERAHPSLLLFPSPGKFVEEWERRTKQWFYQRPFDATVFAENGVVKRLDCGAVAYSAMSDVFHAFTQQEMERYDHLHAGSYQDHLGSLEFEPSVEAELRRPYAVLEKAGVESLRGISKYRDIPTHPFQWAYASGHIGKYAISFAHFGSYIHVGMYDTETKEFHSGSSWTSTEKFHANMPFGNIRLDITPGPLRDKFEPRPGLGFSFRAVDTDAQATLQVDGGDPVNGRVWFEIERGVMPVGMGWLWISVRLANGERICRYDFDQESVSHEPESWSVGKYTVLNTGTKIKDQTAWGIEYTEAFCPVMDGDNLVGYAFSELVRPGWKPFPFRLAMEEKWREWGNYNEHAAALLKTLHGISQLADDIADGDVKGSGPVANFGLAALFELHSNPFYVENKATIDPMILASMRFWEVSDEWTKSTKKRTRIFAYAFRESFRIVSWWVATLAGGDQHGRRVLRDMHEFFSVPGGVESFEAWDREQANAGLR